MNKQADLIVYGGTPAGIGAAIAAARRGKRVLMVEPSAFIGGLMTSGLGETDIRSVDTSGSIFGEFLAHVYEHYVSVYGENSKQTKECNGGLRFEPSVARTVMHKLLGSEPGIEAVCLREIVSVQMDDDRIVSIEVEDVQTGAKAVYGAQQFIDAMYEGDLAAMAGVPYRLGRESRDEWNEEFAGKLYCEYRTKEVLPGSTGEGDDLLQAYNFRLCMTDNPDNRVPFAKPDNYNRGDYTSLLDDIAAGRLSSFGEIVKLSRIPNGKTDTNNHHNCSCSTDLPGENLEYPEGKREVRERIARRHKEYIQGLLWFLQEDEALPDKIRLEASRWGFAADEFPETDHFPPQIYVREARRIIGRYVFTENDARLAPGTQRSPIHFDSIATGDYAIDSHATRKREEIGQNRALEGFLGFGALTEVYQIPFGVILPETVSNLLVPVAVSATHMGFGTIRMEPFWMQLGFAAGVAADMSQSSAIPVQQLCVDRLQDELIEARQIITYFRDVKADHEAHQAMQYFGTKSVFTSYEANPDAACTVADASMWLNMARALPGGARLPALPATDRIAPAGVDIGPRKLAKEQPYRLYWAEKPELSRAMAVRWLDATCRSLGVEYRGRFADGSGHSVTRGEFVTALYKLLKLSRRKR
ncbi:FAD-dependent oxidoreductase [Paenibacillus hemerocallicola]|uniref:FAD-dependent oxidoreductase n=1 Tax=Paenibacillus hemerocallicola TaxID=1172614 RepID=A0A5C4T3E2_9BACL|nr:FAD-dependent oxidoreductase [Paenibacillus hemerocallicola]TNJ62787.1 FAD-dependent oxidoreductase [Paenibacillus hemerocallicola]